MRQIQEAKDPDPVILGVVSPLSYKASHIPGAVNVWRPDYESDTHRVPGMMIEREGFQRLARRLGIDNDSSVVLYDEKLDAARLWWAFFTFGKSDVRVLDGGYPAWKTAGYATRRSLKSTAAGRRGNFVAAERNGWLVSMQTVREARRSAGVQLWDSREWEEWSGEKTMGSAKRPGRIPWARFQNWKEYRCDVNGAPTAFKPAGEVQEIIDRYAMSPDKRQIFYCQSGIRAAVGPFVLYLMGWDPDLLHTYDGSWLEWSRHEKNPVASGV